MSDVASHRRRQISWTLLRGGCADLGEQGGTGARGPAQVRGVEPGDGGLDARRQVARIVVEPLRQAMPWVQRAGRCCPQRPDVVPCLVEPVVGLPQRAPAQVLVGVDERAVTSGVTSQNSISPAMTRRCAASSPGSAASHARPAVTPVLLLPVLLPPNLAPAESGPAAADTPHHPSASMPGDACPE